MRAPTLFAAMAGLLLPAALTGQNFEGSVTYRMEGAGQNGQIVHHVKGRNTRMEFSSGGMSMAMITDVDATRMIVLMPQQKQWMDMKAMQESMARMMGNRMNQENAGEDLDPSDLNIEATGRTETIAGTQCEHYLYKADNTEVDICAAKGMGWYMGAGASALAGGMSGGMAGMMSGRGNRSASVPGMSNAQMEKWREMFADGFFPLKVEANTEQGKILLVVTSIERKSLPESLFAPPADYTEMKMPGGL